MPAQPRHSSLALRPDKYLAFPLDLDAFRACLAFALSVRWEDIVYLCENWDGPLVHAVAMAKFQLASGVEGLNGHVGVLGPNVLKGEGQS